MRNIFITLSCFGILKAQISCSSIPPSAVYAFTTNGIAYEIIKVNMTWTAAAACAVQRGGKLAEILSKQQNDSLFYYAKNKAGITLSLTVANDGGPASYVWIGGNDIQTEGNWIWDGDGNLTGPQFWQGDYLNGNPVGGYYNAWGSVNGGEPDNYINQDGLGLALSSWPYGNAGEWNDISTTNGIYFIVQYPGNVTNLNTFASGPTNNFLLTINDNILLLRNLQNVKKISILSVDGKILMEKIYDTAQENASIDVSELKSGVYLIMLADNFKSSCFKFIK